MNKRKVREITVRKHEGENMQDYNEKDAKFVKEMIKHHESAVTMAADVYHNGKNPEIKKLAEGIYHAQKKEIEQMKKWLEKRNIKQPLSSSMKM
jgi:uncharacterized protein (DUF305 family)